MSASCFDRRESAQRHSVQRWANPIEAQVEPLRSFTMANSNHPNRTILTRDLHYGSRDIGVGEDDVVDAIALRDDLTEGVAVAGPVPSIAANTHASASSYCPGTVTRLGGRVGRVPAIGLTNIHNLDYTVLLCERMTETKAFYRDVMGFSIEYDSESWVTVRLGTALLTLRPRGTDPTGDHDGAAVAGSAEVQLAFRVPPSAVDACHLELLTKGVSIVREPTDIPRARHRTLFFRDPEGNLLEIYAEI